MTEPENTWKPCSHCKKPLPFGGMYWACSVSTCNRGRMALAFCSVPCWDTHVPMMNHKEAWAEERRAPTRQEWEREQSGESPPRPAPKQAAPASPRKNPEEEEMTDEKNDPDKDILIVASKLKDYIRRHSGMNTSADVLEVLSNKVRRLCDDAIENAQLAGRKTVMDRDFR
ncbi:MAG: hypothetical protein AB1405_07525 [Bdellovibrionota bacterium]